MSKDITYLLEDPRSELLDSHLWKALFRFSITTIGRTDKELAVILLRRFWTMRSMGTTIKRTHHGIKFEPILEPIGSWPSKEFYLEMRILYLAPHEQKIKELLDLLKEV